MKVWFKFFIIGVGILTINCAFAVAQPSTASATVLQSISASVISPLSFGSFSVGSGGGTLQIDQSAACMPVPTGDVTPSGGTSCATLNVSASAGQAISLTLDNPNFTLADNFGNTVNGTLALSGSTCYVSGGAPTCSSINIGGTLTLPGIASDPAGNYNTSNAGGQAGSVHLEYN